MVKSLKCCKRFQAFTVNAMPLGLQKKWRCSIYTGSSMTAPVLQMYNGVQVQVILLEHSCSLEG